MKKRVLYGIIFMSRVGRRVIGNLWRFEGRAENGDLVFGTIDGGTFKIPENEARNYLVWKVV